MVFRPELSWEFLPAEEIEAKTMRAMRNHVRHIKDDSPYYQDALKDIHPDDITDRSALERLPFTDKNTLSTQTERFIGVTQQKLVETVVTSGSTGKPITYCLTASDLDRLAYNEALCFYSAGVTEKDRAQIFVSLDRLFIAGIAYYRGLTTLGANTSRIGVLPLEMQKHYLQLLQPTVIVGVPSFLKKLAIELNKCGFDTRNSTITRLFCIGESIRDEKMELNATGRILEEMYRAQVFSTYGATELAVAYCECTAQCGGHAHPELIYTEVVDEAGKPVPDGTPGELVATPLGVEGMPLLRYKTGDITFKISDQCACGRNAARIGPILARKSQMIKIRGTTIYPLTITNILDEFDEINDYLVEIESQAPTSDNVTVHAAVSPDVVTAITQKLHAGTRVHIPVLVSNETTVQSLRGAGRKKLRVLDRRAGTAANPTGPSTTQV
ncbi:MAG: AMP-binding protein [Chitinivibrionales bacterium]|nr:AMP-binding protein [Chitinivibrionales bacterium]